jgi:hypothetical protein
VASPGGYVSHCSGPRRPAKDSKPRPATDIPGPALFAAAAGFPNYP